MNMMRLLRVGDKMLVDEELKALDGEVEAQLASKLFHWPRLLLLLTKNHHRLIPMASMPSGE